MGAVSNAVDAVFGLTAERIKAVDIASGRVCLLDAATIKSVVITSVSGWLHLGHCVDECEKSVYSYSKW